MSMACLPCLAGESPTNLLSPDPPSLMRRKIIEWESNLGDVNPDMRMLR